MENDWEKTTKDKIQFRLDRARGMIESIDMLKDYFKKGDWEIVVGVKQRALNCLTWMLEDAQMFHDEMNRVYEMGYKAGKGEPNTTAQQCVEILEKMRTVHTRTKWECPKCGYNAIDGDYCPHDRRKLIQIIDEWTENDDVIRNNALDEAILAINKQFGIKE